MTRYGDGSIYKRGATLWIRYSHHGEEFRESAHTTSERVASKLLNQRRTEIASNRVAVKEEKVTFKDLTAGILSDYRLHQRRSVKSLRSALKHLEKAFASRRAIDITTPVVRDYVISRQDEGAAASTINREIILLGRAFRIAINDGALSTAPKIEQLPVNNARQGFVDYPDFEQIRAALPEHLKDVIGFLYFSAWRSGEVKSLEWRDVSLKENEIHLRAENSKNGEPRILPLSGELLEIIERADEHRRLDCQFVFHRKGKPLGQLNRPWKRACEAIGYGNLVPHDLRRSGVRNLVRAGVSETVSMKISGHRTRSVFDRYNISSRDDIRNAVDAVQQHLAGTTAPAKVSVLKR